MKEKPPPTIDRKRIAPGLVVGLDVGSQSVPAKVLFVSKYFRNVILLGVYDLPVDRLDAIPTSQPLLLLYTGAQCIRVGRWPRVGILPLIEAEQALSKRIVAGDVWLGDNSLGPATPEEWKTLPHMAVCGCVYVENKIRAALGL